MEEYYNTPPELLGGFLKLPSLLEEDRAGEWDALGGNGTVPVEEADDWERGREDWLLAREEECEVEGPEVVAVDGSGDFGGAVVVDCERVEYWARWGKDGNAGEDELIKIY